MVFEARDGIFNRLCLDASKEPGQRFFLVIDEINRGELPRIFGELLTTIELDKRGRTVTLPVSGESFSIPPNVHLIGTMNTADRSISVFDIALRRRFGFVELMPDSTRLAGIATGGLQLDFWLDALNLRLRKHLKRDARNLQVGHAYLMPQKPITSVADFSRVLRDDIIPLLEEYCYEDFSTLRDILGAELVDVEAGRIRDDIFRANRDDDLISAVSFEEIPSIVLSKAAGLEASRSQDTDDEEPEDSLDDGDAGVG
jgi:5-methylcytosine-specific restriction protein B